MDLVYLSENLAFDSFRAPIQHEYKNTWYYYDSENKRSNAKNSTTKHQDKGGKQHCRLCQDKSKKYLANYIRQKSTCDINNSITEEEE